MSSLGAGDAGGWPKFGSLLDAGFGGVGADSLCVRLFPVVGTGDGLVRAAPGLPHAGSFVVLVSDALRMEDALTVAGVGACLRLPGRGDGEE